MVGLLMVIASVQCNYYLLKGRFHQRVLTLTVVFLHTQPPFSDRSVSPMLLGAHLRLNLRQLLTEEHSPVNKETWLTKVISEVHNKLALIKHKKIINNSIIVKNNKTNLAKR